MRRQVPGKGKDLRWGLTRLTVVASGLLALLIGLIFGFMLWAINGMRASADARKETRMGIVETERFEQLLVDLETGQRGYVITKQGVFLQPWQAARKAFPSQAREFESHASTPAQKRRAAEITRGIDSYIHDYSVPLVKAAQRGDSAVSSLAATAEGKRLADALRDDFTRYMATERDLLDARADTANANAERAVIAASAGLGVSILLIVGFTVYQSRAIVRPTRRAAAVAKQIADGDLGVRMALTGPAEIGALGASFNTMARSLQESRARTEAARRRLRLLYDTSVSVGTTLDVERTARELVQVVVPQFADFATADLLTPVQGETPQTGASQELQRVAVGGIREDHPFRPVGTRRTPDPSTPYARSLGTRLGHIEADLRTSTSWRAGDPEYAGRILDEGVHSLITAPMLSRGDMMGVLSFWRSRQGEPFDEEDVSLAEELAAKGAVAIDNARRYTRERATALTLQRSLLPQRLPEQAAVEVASRYLPTGELGGVGGDWFDVIPLSGTRVALVVGDVVGHGLHAAAAMGRLRTAVRTLADVDLPPDELLTHLDDLVIRLADGEETSEETHDPAAVADLGATCLYAVYDPVSRRCTFATAGHPLPVVLTPDGTAAPVSGHIGPPLGIGGLPFETTELELEPSSVLALYTDGLIESREHDIDRGIAELCRALARPAATLEEACDIVTGALLPERPADDVALLLARTRALSPDQVATWDIAADPSQVERARRLVVDQLDAWGLSEAAFITELVASELVTNAVRHGAPPIRLRVIRDRTLICEVSDGSSTAPHLRRARETDEGGRGLLLVAGLTQSWGTRQTTTGKTIWCEQPLPDF
ncbi:SpoIIE family protein phosphatase [Streptomyces liangshanensis]|uniref:SpoIIE family protein phosphatase n=1 Tax=Streptomyces liangshanensis TaxID=2717324 RepID=A0A6G9H2U9_9ACTN|nr:SpoIIE family protein phosphatase [Streptomyces liangshanensis]QIQ04646.1 SpoIIE family protein phosphatase [Streptomyces liangshanensis]